MEGCCRDQTACSCWEKRLGTGGFLLHFAISCSGRVEGQIACLLLSLSRDAWVVACSSWAVVSRSPAFHSVPLCSFQVRNQCEIQLSLHQLPILLAPEDDIMFYRTVLVCPLRISVRSNVKTQTPRNAKTLSRTATTKASSPPLSRYSFIRPSTVSRRLAEARSRLSCRIHSRPERCLERFLGVSCSHGHRRAALRPVSGEVVKHAAGDGGDVLGEVEGAGEEDHTEQKEENRVWTSWISIYATNGSERSRVPRCWLENLYPVRMSDWSCDESGRQRWQLADVLAMNFSVGVSMYRLNVISY